MQRDPDKALHNKPLRQNSLYDEAPLRQAALIATAPPITLFASL